MGSRTCNQNIFLKFKNLLPYMAYSRPHKIWHSTKRNWHWPKIKTQSCKIKWV